MKGVIWASGARIIRQILDWLRTSSSSSLQDFRTDFIDAGVVKGVFNEFEIIAGSNNTALTPSITVRTGVAYDINGERIVIDDQVNSYDATLPTHTTDNGLSVNVSTPRSTGNVNIPLTVNTINYIYIDYLPTVDDGVFTLHKQTNAKIFYKATDGYKITVNTTGVPPTVNSLKLGQVDLSSSGTVSGSTISTTGRAISGVKYKRTKVKTPLADRSNATATYTSNTEVFVDDHISAVGSGVISAKNPHGLAAEDLGLSSTNNIDTHQKFLHSNGLVGDPASTTSSLYASIVAVTPGMDMVSLKAFSGVETAVVDGTTVSGIDIPADVSVTFTSADAAGTWYIYVDKATRSIKKTTVNLIAVPDKTKLLLYTVVFTYPGALGSSDGDLNTLVDYRVFGNIATRELQNKAVTPDKIDGTVAGSGLVGGNGAPLSVNPDNTTTEIISDQVSVKANGIGPTHITTGVAGSGLTGGNGSALSVVTDNSTVEISSNQLRVKASGIGSSHIASGSINGSKFQVSTMTFGSSATVASMLIANAFPLGVTVDIDGSNGSLNYTFNFGYGVSVFCPTTFTAYSGGPRILPLNSDSFSFSTGIDGGTLYYMPMTSPV